MCIFLCWFCGKVLSLSLTSPPNFQVGGQRHRRALLPGKYPSPFSHFHQHPVPSSNLQNKNQKTQEKSVLLTSTWDYKHSQLPNLQNPKNRAKTLKASFFLLSTFNPIKQNLAKVPPFCHLLNNHWQGCQTEGGRRGRRQPQQKAKQWGESNNRE